MIQGRRRVGLFRALLAGLAAAFLPAPGLASPSKSTALSALPSWRRPGTASLSPASVRPAAGGGAVAPGAASPAGPAAPAPSSTFLGILDNNVFAPPDTMGSVGPNHVVVMQNIGAKILDKSGNVVASLSNLNTFWTNGALSITQAYDPRVYYDEDSGRFFAFALDAPNSSSSALLIAVSNSSDPTTLTASSWYYRKYTAYDSSNNSWADFPTIGINQNWVTFGVNMYPVGGASLVQPKMYVFSKSQLLSAGAPAPLEVLTGSTLDPSAFGAFAIAGALTFGSQPDLYFIDNSGYVDNTQPYDYLRISRLTATGGGCSVSAPCWSLVSTTDNAVAGGPGFIKAPTRFDLTRTVPPAPQADPTQIIDTGDTRVSAPPVVRNGSLWITHHAGLPYGGPNRVSVFWYQIDISQVASGGNASIIQSGVIDDPATPTYYLYPSISVDALGDAAVGLSATSRNQFVGAYYTGRLSTDSSGTMQSLYQYKPGLATYYKPTFNASGTPQRWGDYSATMVDPAQNLTFWTIQEYAEVHNICGNSTGCFGTQWAKFSLAQLTAAPSSFGAQTLGTSSVAWNWAMLPGATSYNLYYATNTASFIMNVATPTVTFTGLPANAAQDVFVKGFNSAGEGPGTTAPPLSTLAQPIAGVSTASAVGQVVSVSYPTCPASPASASCEGYTFQASTASDFSGTVSSIFTTNPNLGVLSLSSLSQLPGTYYFRLGTLDSLRDPNFVPVLLNTQGTSAATLGVSSITWSWSPVLGAQAYDVYYATNPSSLIAAGLSVPSLTLTGLPANYLTAILVRGVDALGREGAGTTAASTSTLALPITSFGVPAATAFISSISVSFVPCPASPPSSSCEGYALDASTAPDFSGMVFSSGTADRSVSALAVGGLASLTTYYLRLATLSGSGGSDYSAVAATATMSSLLAPFFAGLSVSSTSIGFTWSRGGNPSGLLYSVDASNSPAFTPPVRNIQGTDIFSATFTALAVNTTYYLRVKAVGGPSLLSGPVSTLAAAPSAASPPYSGINTSQLTANWSLGADPPGTSFIAQLATTPDFSGALASVPSATTNASFSGLVSNTTYYVRVQAVNNGGVGTGFLVLPATSTLAQAVTLPAQPFSAQTGAGFTASFLNSGGNAAGTFYVALISTASDFSAVAASVVTTNTYAAYSGLVSNATYYFEAAAVNNSGALSPFSPSVSTVTLPAPPAAASPLGGLQTTSSLRVFWAAGGNAAPTIFTAQLSNDPAFGGSPASSTTANPYADFSGLLANTTYYLRVKALSVAPSNPDGAFASLGGASTLAVPPGAPASPFFSATYSSVTVQWIALPASPQTAAAEGYLVQASTDPAFGGRLFTSVPFPASATQGGPTGLLYSTTYYLRVGSLNWNGLPDFTSLGSTVTLTPAQAVQTVSDSGATLTISPSSSPLKSIRVDVPGGTFPTGTVVTLNTSVQLDLPPPASNEGSISALSPGAGFSLAAGGLEPTGPVLLTISFDPRSLPAGADPKSLALARYDDAAGQWTFLPTYVDTSQDTLTARLLHFSFYAPFLVAASASVDDVAIFPIPWEPGSGHALFDAPALTFSNLTADAAVSVYNINGELLWKAQASPGGVLTWDGNNRFGRKAASGTYLAVIEGAGKRVVRRVALIR